jgi:hypothetical protein
MRARLAAINWFEELIVALFAIGDAAIVWLAIAALIRAHNPDRIVVAPLAIGVGALLANIVPRVSVLFGWRWWIGYVLAGLGFLVTIAIWTKSGAFPHVSWFNFSWLGDLLDGFAIKGAGVGEVVWLSVIGAGAIWRRGAGRAGISVDLANEQLRQGGAAAVAVLAINAALSGGVGNAAASLAVIVFFASSLTAISLARSTVMLGGVDVGRTKSPSIIAGPAAIIVGVGLLAGALISRDLLNTIIWLLGYPVGAVWFVARYVLLGVAFAALIILWPIFWLLQRFMPHPAGMKIAMPSAPPQEADKLVQNSTTSQMPDFVRWGIAGLVFLIVCLVVIRIATNRRQAQLIAGDETREKLAGDDGGSLLGDLWAKFRRRRGGPDPLADLRGKPEWAHTLAIREAFGQFLEWTRERGLARKPASTVTEHGAAFEASLPAPSQEAETLLAGYRKIRYRSTPATASDAETTVEAWRRLQRDQQKEGE